MTEPFDDPIVKGRPTPGPTESGTTVSRRGFLHSLGVLGAVAGFESVAAPGLIPEARPPQEPRVLDGSDGPIELRISELGIEIEGRRARATMVNESLPGPILRFREGDEAVIHVRNDLTEDTSIHWHGILLPNAMDGVPGITFPGIRPGEVFTYSFPIRQYGTYWYHSHSGFQEQVGHYGALVIDPASEEPFTYDREYVVVLSDWTFEDPHRVHAKLKKDPDYYNNQRRTLFDFFRDVGALGLRATLSDRLEWGRMRMNPTDIADVSGTTYTYLMNGTAPEGNWSALFRPGERVRLRFINAGAGTSFDVRIPGLSMSIVQASGQHIRPVETDEFRIAPGETFDAIVAPEGDEVYAIFAEAMDRSGFAFGSLTSHEGAIAAVPARRSRPLLTMADMGMDHGGDGGHAMIAAGAMGEDPGHADHGAPAAPSPVEDHSAHLLPGEEGRSVEAARAPGSIPEPVAHGPDRHGSGNAGTPEMVSSRLGEPGVGLGKDGWRVLTYADLEALDPASDLRAPEREIELHLTGNMERFQWSIDGVPFPEAEDVPLTLGERIRLIVVNDTMMGHPMHLHGMWMELENGKGAMIPRVHTVEVKPAERMSLLVTADAPGPWPFHCHLLYHMHEGMFRIFRVGAEGTDMESHEGHGSHARISEDGLGPVVG